MQYEQTKDIRIMQISCNDDGRFLPVTRAAIDVMKRSLEEHGQMNPISVYPVSRGTYRVIAGATRFRAASELKWDTIRATIWTGSALDFQILELADNLDCHPGKRRAIKSRMIKLQHERAAALKAARKAEREAEKKRKLLPPPPPLPPSVFQPPSPSAKTKEVKRQLWMSPEEDRRLDAWCKSLGIHRSEGIRRLVRQGLDAVRQQSNGKTEAMPPPPERKAADETARL